MNLLDIFFPKVCVGCKRWGRYVCAECVNKLVVSKKQLCPMCNKPSMWGQTHAKCRKSWGMDGLVTVFEYGGVVQHIIQKIKYGFVSDMVGELAEAMMSVGDFTPLEQEDWTVVPVPLHTSRLRKRGFNQSDLLGKYLSEYTGWTLEKSWVKRVRNTTPQTELSGKERRNNVRGAFDLVVESSQVTDKNILLIDDVWTTGSTMKEVGKVLKRNGAKRVWGIVVAS